MRLTRIGDIIALLALIPVLTLTTRAGSHWLALAATQTTGPVASLALLGSAMTILLAVLGWAIYRLTGGVSLVAGLSLAAAGLAAVSLGYPTWQRNQQMHAFAPVFASDFGPTKMVPAPKRVRLADYRNGEVYARGVACPTDCLALLYGGAVDEVALGAPFGQNPAGLSAKLDRETPGCAEIGGCVTMVNSTEPLPRLTILRSLIRADSSLSIPPEAQGYGFDAWIRVEVYLDGERILRRTSARASGLQTPTLPTVTMNGLGYSTSPVWLSPQRLTAHGPLARILEAVTR